LLFGQYTTGSFIEWGAKSREVLPECGIPREEASDEELRLCWPVLVLTICKTP
jgi:hypothetical protein